MTSRVELFRSLLETTQEAAKINGVNPEQSLLLLNESVGIVFLIYESYEKRI